MRRWRTPPGGPWSVPFVLSLVFACGTSKRHVESDTGAAGADQAGAGGTVLTGGASGAGGSAMGGRGGSPTRCDVAPDITACEPSLGFFYHDPATHECVHSNSFTCTSDANFFGSLAECLATCPGATPGLYACDFSYQCAIKSAGCCALCPDATYDQAVAVNVANQDGDAACAGVNCSPCAPVPELVSTLQYLVPACMFGWCQVTSLAGSTASTVCAVDGDCMLRDGAECCPGCDGRGLVAVSSTAAIEELCPPDYACDACVSSSDGYRARCFQGSCEVGTALQ